MASISKAVWGAAAEVRGTRRVYFVGHSLGCFIAAQLASVYPDEVVGATYIEGGLFHVADLLKSPVKNSFRHPIWMLKLAYALLTATVRPSPKYCDSLNSGSILHYSLWPFLRPELTAVAPSVGDSFRDQGGTGARRLLSLAADVDIYSLYRNVSQATRFIYGSRDPLINGGDSATMSDTGTALESIEVHSAHWPQVELPTIVSRLILTDVERLVNHMQD